MIMADVNRRGFLGALTASLPAASRPVSHAPAPRPLAAVFNVGQPICAGCGCMLRYLDQPQATGGPVRVWCPRCNRGWSIHVPAFDAVELDASDVPADAR
jgi:hypothetical protein